MALGQDAVHEIGLGDQFIGRPNQDLDDFERAGANRHRDAARQQLASSEVDLPLPGLINKARALLGHPGVPDSGFFSFVGTLPPMSEFRNPALNRGFDRLCADSKEALTRKPARPVLACSSRQHIRRGDNQRCIVGDSSGRRPRAGWRWLMFWRPPESAGLRTRFGWPKSAAVQAKIAVGGTTVPDVLGHRQGIAAPPGALLSSN